TVDASANVISTGSLQVNTGTVTNSGTLKATAGTLGITTTGALSVLDSSGSGTAGTMFGGNGIIFTAGATGDLNVKQLTMTGAVGGSGQNIDITAGSALTLGTLTGTNGNHLKVTVTSGALTVNGNVSATEA